MLLSVLVQSTLPSTIPVSLDMIVGFEGAKLFKESWYVPKKLYRLSRVKMFKNANETSGFEVTFEVPPRFGF